VDSLNLADYTEYKFLHTLTPSVSERLKRDVPAATAILDRFLQDAEVIQITGRSYRLRGKSADEKKASSKAAKPANSKSKSGHTRKPAQP